jgi:hypothetical protein
VQREGDDERQPTSLFSALCSCESNKEYFDTLEVIRETQRDEAHLLPAQVTPGGERPQRAMPEESPSLQGVAASA